MAAVAAQTPPSHHSEEAQQCDGEHDADTHRDMEAAEAAEVHDSHQPGEHGGGDNESLWRPLSFAEKNILKARKKLREVEKIEEAMVAGDSKIEQTQLEKVKKKSALEQELRTLEKRSRAQGGRTLDELEKAEQWRRQHEERERAAICVQKVVRGHLVRIALEKQYEEEDAAQEAAAAAAASKSLPSAQQEPAQQTFGKAPAKAPSVVPPTAPPTAAPEERLPAIAGRAPKSTPPVAAPKSEPVPQQQEQVATGKKAPPSQPPKQPPVQPPVPPPKQPEKRLPSQPPSQPPSVPAPIGKQVATPLAATAIPTAAPAQPPQQAHQGGPKQPPQVPTQPPSVSPQVPPTQPPQAAPQIAPPQPSPQELAPNGRGPTAPAPTMPAPTSPAEALAMAAARDAPAADETAIQAKKCAEEHRRSEDQHRQDELRRQEEQHRVEQQQQQQQRQQQQQQQQEQLLQQQQQQDRQRQLQQRQLEQQRFAAAQAAAEAEAQRQRHLQEVARQQQLIQQNRLAAIATAKSVLSSVRLEDLEWFYRTPEGIVQGPFSNGKMRAWHAYGYFAPELPTKINMYNNFYPLRSLFPDFQQAFQLQPTHPQQEVDFLVAQAPPPPMHAMKLPPSPQSLPHGQQSGGMPAPSGVVAAAFGSAAVAATGVPAMNSPQRSPSFRPAPSPGQSLPHSPPLNHNDPTTQFGTQPPPIGHPGQHHMEFAVQAAVQQHQQQQCPAQQQQQPQQQSPQSPSHPTQQMQQARSQSPPQPPSQPQQLQLHVPPGPQDTAHAPIAQAPPPPSEAAPLAPVALTEPSATPTSADPHAGPEQGPDAPSGVVVAAADAAASEAVARGPEAGLTEPAKASGEENEEEVQEREVVQEERPTKDESQAVVPTTHIAGAAVAKSAPASLPAGISAVPVGAPAGAPPAAPAASAAKTDGQADAFAKFFKRIGGAVPIPPEEASQDRSTTEAPPPRPPSPPTASSAAIAGLEDQAPDTPEPSEAGVATPAAAPPSPQAAPTKEPPAKDATAVTEEPPLATAKEPAVWPRRKEEATEVRRKDDPKASPKIGPKPAVGLGLPPPGTVTKRTAGEHDELPAPSRSIKDPPIEDEDSDRIVQEVSPLDHRFVGLVIGKAGETIKHFKKTSGANIEIDQNLPDGMPRAVIYRGTRKQVNAAKKLVDTLVHRAKEDERNKASATPVGAGMGIMGRGPAGDRDRHDPSVGETAGRKEGAADSERPRAVGGASQEGDVPSWRRGEGVGEVQGAARPSPGADGLRPRVGGLGRRELPWSTKRERDVEAAPSGSLTGSLSLSGGGGLGMRPAWMKPNKTSAEGSSGHDDGLAMLGPFDKSIWHEQKYSRCLLLQAKLKILRGKAYEVPEEMMTMTTGARPKEKKERKEKELDDAREEHPADQPEAGADEASVGETKSPHGEAALPSDAATDATSALASTATPKKSKSSSSASAGPYENQPGDSKDILKLKKKLREIRKIEESIVAGEAVEPNQVEKVTKKAGYVEELRMLESFARANSPEGCGA